MTGVGHTGTNTCRESACEHESSLAGGGGGEGGGERKAGLPPRGAEERGQWILWGCYYKSQLIIPGHISCGMGTWGQSTESGDKVELSREQSQAGDTKVQALNWSAPQGMSSKLEEETIEDEG